MDIRINNVSMTGVGGERTISGPTPREGVRHEGYFMEPRPLSEEYKQMMAEKKSKSFMGVVSSLINRVRKLLKRA